MFLQQLRAMTDSGVVLPPSPAANGNGQDGRKSSFYTGRELPVRRHKARIVEKVKENRVTIILADTGSGKSSQVPQMLLEEAMGPILCTQPRRLAVVTVAKRVAEERGCNLGTEVGYQIGQLNVSTSRSLTSLRSLLIRLDSGDKDTVHYSVDCAKFGTLRMTLFSDIRKLTPSDLFTRFSNIESKPKAAALLSTSFWGQPDKVSSVDELVKSFLAETWKMRTNVLYDKPSFYLAPSSQGAGSMVERLRHAMSTSSPPRMKKKEFSYLQSIGSPIWTQRSKIVFKTAGVLLEELRSNGVAAINKYKVIILDEVHERSVESDLVLACVKQLLRGTSVKLVLMSATADFLKYEAYFKDIDRGERVEKIAIQNLAEKLQSIILNTKVMYLEQVVKILGNVPKHTSLLDAMTDAEECGPAEKGIDLGEDTLNIMRDLIVHLHHKEQDLSKNVLVFLPTYRSLEQQWLLLKGSKAPLKVFVLHSSVDIEDSIRAMEVCPLNKRKVILATNVAESSVTIPGVSFVIDSCRSLEIFWDVSSQRHQPRLKWISESQANQRKGRTGRTCDGVVYRMVPRNLFLKFDKFETPAMQLISLKKQILMILTSVSKPMNDPSALLKKCMNPPAVDTVDDALDALEDMEAIESDQKGKHRPTLYGRLLVSLPLSLESSVMVIRGGQLGYVRESAILASILDGTPNPVLKPFGNPFKYQNFLGNYYKPLNGEEIPSHATIMLANMYAYNFWQGTFKDKQRLDKLSQQAGTCGGANGSSVFQGEDSELEWCTCHHLNLTSLHAVEETVDAIMESLHRFRPEFLNNVSGSPAYLTSSSYKHTCCPFVPDSGNGGVPDDSDNWSYQESDGRSIQDKDESSHEDTDFVVVDREDGGIEADDEKICLRSPFTVRGEFHTYQEEQILTALVIEVFYMSLSIDDLKVRSYAYIGFDGILQVQKGYDQPLVKPLEDDSSQNQQEDDIPLCSFFQRGMCIKGDRCNFSHSPFAKPTRCKFFLSPSGCRFGASCLYYHDNPDKFELPPNSEPVHFDESSPTPSSMLDLLPPLEDGQYLLLFGEGDFSFAESLCSWICPHRIIATSLDNEEIVWSIPTLNQRVDHLRSLNMQIHWNVDVKALVNCPTGRSVYLTKPIPWWDVKCIIWNFPFTDVDEDTAGHRELMVKFFASLNIMINTRHLYIQSSIPIIITLCNDQFCRWRVERAARASFFFLTRSSPFDAKAFGGYCPVRNNLLSTFPVERPMIYLFSYHQPTVDP